jgi:2-polyprenyl-6-methoxyphenol hydroxylase-like FAD-dependent oxidoreductase
MRYHALVARRQNLPANAQSPVLIVGAGPTGLVLAFSLARQGVPVRIVDKNSGPGQASRAMAVHARTLEFYRQFGFGDEVVARGIKMETASMRSRGKEKARISLKNMGGELSPYPFALSLPQDEHEQFLNTKLAALGVKVEWNTELKSLTQDANGVQAVLSRGGVEETASASYLAGCDGARSAVRQGLGIGFPGGTYEHFFYVADVKLDKPMATDITANLGEDAFALVLPVRTSGMHRVVGIIPDGIEKDKATFEDVRSNAETLIGAKIPTVNWFSTYSVHHRVAEKFRLGRCFLAGDAGHIHSPFGGQGMNTGIGDAINLGWKLAAVLKGRAAPDLLDTYEPERIGFARKLVATTDRAFQGVVARGLTGKFMRAWLMPKVMKIATGFGILRRVAFRTLSQTRITYRSSTQWNEGHAGALSGGDRLPWSGQDANFAPLQSLDWQLHVYGEADKTLAAAAQKLNLPLHRFADSAAARKAGFKADAAYLVRPDGYIALVFAQRDTQALEAYARKHALKFAEPAPAPKAAPPAPGL